MSPKVSIVVSTYNRPEKLKRAIQSMLAQTFDDWELIVVHDGPWDPTELPQDDRIRYTNLEKNFGNDTQPKNKGTELSTGEYVGYLDDDNTYRPDHLAILVKELDEHPEYDGVYGNRYVIAEDNSFPPRIGTTSNYKPSLLLQKNYIDTGDILLRRQALFDVGGWDERYKKYVDWNLWLRMAKAGKRFKHVTAVVSDYYVHADMKSLTVKDRTPEGLPAVPLGSEPSHSPEWDPFSLEIKLPYLGEIREPRVAIFTITYDRLDYTQKAFESLRKTAGYPFDHYVVDNASQDKTPEWLQAEQAAKRIKQIVLNADNKGISIASNQAVDAIGPDSYDIIVKFDNDCICLTPGWLKKMVEIWKVNHMLAMSPYVQGLKDNPGGAPRIAHDMVLGELVGLTKHLGGICHFVDASAYKTWRWDEQSSLHGMQDLEFSQKLLFSGYQMLYLENFYVSHGPLGTEAQKKDFPSYFERRRDEKIKRYEPPAQRGDQP